MILNGLDLNSCVTTASYQMTAEFYRATVNVLESGQRRRAWDYSSYVERRVRAEAILGGGIRLVGSTREFSYNLEDVEYMKMYLADLNLDGSGGITKSTRVGSVKGTNGEVLWKDGDDVPVVFMVQGIQPVVDPFGNVQEYELLLKGVTDD